MARVAGIINAGLSAGSLPQTAPPASEIDLFKSNAGRNVDVETAGLPSDLLTAGAAGAGIGAIFGPVGAILGASLVHHLSSRRREGIAAYQAALAEDAGRAYEKAQAGLAEMTKLASNDEERAELAAKRNYIDQLAGELGSADPARRAQAATQMMSETGTLQDDIDGWFDERREAAATAREIHANNVTRAENIRDDYVKESGDFDTVRSNYEAMLSTEDSSWGDQVLMVRAFKVIDPNSAVLPGEAATAANVAGAPDWAITVYNRLAREGGRLGPQERADILRQTGLQYGAAYAEQVDRRTGALERARVQGVPDDMLPGIHSAVRVPTTDDVPMPPKQELSGTDKAALMGLDIARDEYGVVRAYEPGRAGQPGYTVRDIEIPQDARGQAGLEAEAAGPNADIDPETGEPLGFLEALVTPGAIDARRRRMQSAARGKRPTN